MSVLIVLLVAAMVLGATEVVRRAVAGRHFEQNLQIIPADHTTAALHDLAA